MWIINKSLDVLRTLRTLSLNNVSTWNFSALYTSLPYAKLKLQLHDLLERVFTTRGKTFIATNSYHTFWTNDRKSTKYTYFTCRQLCLAVDFLIDNIYVRFGNSVFNDMGLVPKFRKGRRCRTKLEQQNYQMKEEMTDYLCFSPPRILRLAKYLLTSGFPWTSPSVHSPWYQWDHCSFNMKLI